MSAAEIDRGRDLLRAWNAGRDRIVAALPERLADAFMRRPQNWLEAAYRRICAPELAAAGPEDLVEAAVVAAGYGLAPYDGRFVVLPYGRATFVPSVSAMKAALLACDLTTVLCDVVRPGDGLDVDRDRHGNVLHVRHDRRPGGNDFEYRQVWAYASSYAVRPPWFATELLDRAELEQLAATRLRIPGLEEPAQDAAKRIALILLSERVEMDLAWAPVRRWRAMVDAMWFDAERAA